MDSWEALTAMQTRRRKKTVGGTELGKNSRLGVNSILLLQFSESVLFSNGNKGFRKAGGGETRNGDNRGKTKKKKKEKRWNTVHFSPHVPAFGSCHFMKRKDFDSWCLEVSVHDQLFL